MTTKRFPLESFKVESCKECPALIGQEETHFGCSWGQTVKYINNTNRVPIWCPLSDWNTSLYERNKIVDENVRRDCP